MEVGSIFEIDIDDLFAEENQGKELFPFMNKKSYMLDYYNTGRSAIESLFRFFKKKNENIKVFLPTYNCDSVIRAVERAGVDIEFYSVSVEFSLDGQELETLMCRPGDVLYLVQYFGKPLQADIVDAINTLQNKGVIIVEDISLCLLSSSNTIGLGDYIIGSLRKWFAIPDGGFIASSKDLPDTKKAQAANDYTLYYFAAQLMKKKYLNAKGFRKEKYLELTNKAMSILFSDYKIREMSLISKKLLKAQEISSICKRRDENYKNLYERLSNIPQLKIMVPYQSGVIPLGLVIAVNDRDDLLSWLIKNDVYCNIHWRTNDYMVQDSGSKWLSKHCLTIPCDQRYSKISMKKIEQIIREFFEVQNV